MKNIVSICLGFFVFWVLMTIVLVQLLGIHHWIPPAFLMVFIPFLPLTFVLIGWIRRQKGIPVEDTSVEEENPRQNIALFCLNWFIVWVSMMYVLIQLLGIYHWIPQAFGLGWLTVLPLMFVLIGWLRRKRDNRKPVEDT